jgi:hypothetical protein
MNLLVKSTTTTNVVIIPSAKKIKLYGQELKSALCGLVNGRGGVILFGCTESKGCVLAKGELLAETTKESLLQKLMEIFENFSPKLTFSNHAHLSFVPVAYRPDESSSELVFREGVFVTRLRIWNNERARLIFYLEGGQPYLCRGDPNQEGVRFKVQNVKGRDILRLMRRQFKEFYVPEGWGKSEQLLMSNNNLHCFSDHQCPEPLIGRQIASEKQQDFQEHS